MQRAGYTCLSTQLENEGMSFLVFSPSQSSKTKSYYKTSSLSLSRYQHNEATLSSFIFPGPNLDRRFGSIVIDVPLLDDRLSQKIWIRTNAFDELFQTPATTSFLE